MFISSSDALLLPNYYERPSFRISQFFGFSFFAIVLQHYFFLLLKHPFYNCSLGLSLSSSLSRFYVLFHISVALLLTHFSSFSIPLLLVNSRASLRKQKTHCISLYLNFFLCFSAAARDCTLPLFLCYSGPLHYSGASSLANKAN